MQNEIALLRTNNSMLRSSVETLFNELEEAKMACQFIMKNATNQKSTSKTLGVTFCNPVSEIPDLKENSVENWEQDSQSLNSQYSDCTVRFPIWHQCMLQQLCVIVKKGKNP